MVMRVVAASDRKCLGNAVPERRTKATAGLGCDDVVMEQANLVQSVASDAIV